MNHDEWREALKVALAEKGQRLDDVICIAGDLGSSITGIAQFTVWTETHVYFPEQCEGQDRVNSVPRSPPKTRMRPPHELTQEMQLRCRTTAWGGTTVDPEFPLDPVRHREHSLRLMIEGWAAWGESHERLYSCKIAEDAFCGPLFATMARTLIEMLNAELGRHDGGDLDKLVREVSLSCGISRNLGAEQWVK